MKFKMAISLYGAYAYSNRSVLDKHTEIVYFIHKIDQRKPYCLLLIGFSNTDKNDNFDEI